MGRPLQGGPGHHGQLPGHRLRRRHRAVQRGHRRLRRDRLGDEGRRDHDRAEEGQRSRPRPDGPRRGHRSYNVDGIDQGLKLDGKTVADIFLGKIKKWNDPEIAGQNSGAQLPSTNITVCHRSDESGTTANFTSFLTDYSSEWKSGPGTDKSVKWPTGTGAKGNDGVAGCVKQTKGAVGYVEQAYALQNKFTTAAIKNKSGKYIEPSLQATSAPAEGITPPDDLRFSTINAESPRPTRSARSRSSLVWQDACKAGQNATQAKLVKNWLTYALGAGQQVAPQLEYAPLPDNIKTKAQAKVDGLQCNGAAINGAS